MIKYVLAFFLFLSCTDNKPAVPGEGKEAYFDLKGFFKQESERLGLQNTPVLKTIDKDGIRETKKVRIASWAKELDLFSGSDINKLAWKDSYHTDTLKNGAILYQATDSTLRTKSVRIDKNSDGSVYRMVIVNAVSNLLYLSAEELTYYPDSLYQINKYQKVRFLGSHYYRIIGKTAK